MKKIIDVAFGLSSIAFWIGATVFCGGMVATRAKGTFGNEKPADNTETPAAE